MKEKKAHGVQLLIRCVVKDPDGKIISDTGRKPAESFVLQLLIYIGALFNAVDTKAKNIDGTSINWMYYTLYETNEPSLAINAAVNVADYGIVVGTGDTAVDNADFKLETQLTEGTGAGQITHGASNMGTTAVVGANVDIEHGRAFTNNTGSTITVREAGIYARCGLLASNRIYCIIRDVLLGAVEIPDRCSLSVYYTFRTTV